MSLRKMISKKVIQIIPVKKTGGVETTAEKTLKKILPFDYKILYLENKENGNYNFTNSRFNFIKYFHSV